MLSQRGTAIDQTTALNIARRRAEDRGWAFAEPIAVSAHRGCFGRTIVSYSIRSNAGRFGTTARFVIDATTGVILTEGYISR